MPPSPGDGNFSRWDAYAPILRRMARAKLDVTSALASELRLYADDQIGLFYAPFDHVEVGARIAIVGVTPGPRQASEAIRCARAGLDAGHDHDRIQADVKYAASFKGMRYDLVSWFNAIGLAEFLGLGSCDELFSTAARGMIHTTSAARYPTFERKSGGWRCWSGHGVDALEHRVLKAMIEKILGPELRTLNHAVIVPLGKANYAVEHLCRTDRLDTSQCVLGMPHPSTESARRHQIFANRRDDLERQVAQLRRLAGPRPTSPSSVTNAAEADTPARIGDEIRIVLTAGNIRNGHVYLRQHLRFFPSDAVGPANSADGTGTPLQVHFAGDAKPVLTDIAGDKMIFRCRRPVAAFFRRHGLTGGDVIALRRIGPRDYDVRPLRT